MPIYESLFEDSLEVHGIDWIIVFAYFDETGIHESALDTVVAGYLFSKDGAKLFRQIFLDNIYPSLPADKHGIRMYRSTKCILGYDQFQGMKETEREHIVDLMVEAIKKSAMLGVVIGVEKQEYAKAIANSPELRQRVGSEYSVCLMRCIEIMAAWLNDKEIQGRLQYVLESGCQHEEEANLILARISKSDELKRRYRWHNYSFIEKSPDVPQLFAPDLLAWEWQRARVNSLNPQRGEWRLTLAKLCDGTPHIMKYQTDISLDLRALVNVFYGLTRP